jgi:hypothetical protein
VAGRRPFTTRSMRASISEALVARARRSVALAIIVGTSVTSERLLERGDVRHVASHMITHGLEDV